MSKKIRIYEVGPRDGLQNEVVRLTPNLRIQFIKKLIASGVRHIETGAFVSEKWVPQMAGSAKISKKMASLKAQGNIPKDVKLCALVPNSYGMKLALASDVEEVAVFGAASESFSKMNINCSIDESLERFKQVADEAKKNKIRVRAYLSTVFGCPFEGEVSEAKVVKLTEKMLELGAYEVSLGDTIGVADPKQVERILKKIEKRISLKKIAMHFHDTRGTGLANVIMSLQMGITSFDSSLGGLGGCPYAPAATGNIATEDLVYTLHRMGYSTGIELSELIKINHWMAKHVKRSLPSKLGAAGIPKRVPVKKRKL